MKILAMDGEVRKHLKDIRDFQGKLANYQCNANNQTAQIHSKRRRNATQR